MELLFKHPGVWIFAAMIALMIIVNAVQSNKYRPFLERQAMMRNGIVKNSLITYPILDFPVEDRRVVLRLWAKTKNSPAQTSLKCKLKSLERFRLVVVHSSRASLFSKISQGLANEAAGISPFDQDFDIQSNDQALAQAIMGEDGVQQALLELKNWNPRLKVVRGKFRLFVDRIFQDDSGYDRLINNGIFILRKVLQECRLRGQAHN